MAGEAPEAGGEEAQIETRAGVLVVLRYFCCFAVEGFGTLVVLICVNQETDWGKEKTYSIVGCQRRTPQRLEP